MSTRKTKRGRPASAPILSSKADKKTGALAQSKTPWWRQKKWLLWSGGWVALITTFGSSWYEQLSEWYKQASSAHVEIEYPKPASGGYEVRITNVAPFETQVKFEVYLIGDFAIKPIKDSRYFVGSHGLEITLQRAKSSAENYPFQITLKMDPSESHTIRLPTISPTPGFSVKCAGVETILSGVALSAGPSAFLAYTLGVPKEIKRRYSIIDDAWYAPSEEPKVTTSARICD